VVAHGAVDIALVTVYSLDPKLRPETVMDISPVSGVFKVAIDIIGASNV
jgi:hypothetical protein